MIKIYIRTYDKLAKHMKILETVFIKNVDVSRISFPEFVYGRHVLSNYIKGKFSSPSLYHMTSNIEDLLDVNTIDKFIIDRNGNIFATPSSYLYIVEEFMPSMIELRFAKNIIPDELFILYKLKKKGKLSRGICNLVFLHICKLYFKDAKKLICKNCHSEKNKNNECTNCCNICGKNTTDKILCRGCKIFHICSTCNIRYKYCYPCIDEEL